MFLLPLLTAHAQTWRYALQHVVSPFDPSIRPSPPFCRSCMVPDASKFSSLHLRQRLIERKFEQALEDLGSPSRHHTVLEGYTVNESREYPVTSVLKDLHTNETYIIESKTIVGVDGGHSFVRKTAGIEFKGDRSANKWIRLDVSWAYYRLNRLPRNMLI